MKGEARAYRPMLLVVLTCINVAMQLGSALLLKLAPEFGHGRLLVLAVFLGAVLALNVSRFMIWGALHKRYPLSLAYPLSALFFPGVLLMAWWFGEDVGMPQFLGGVCVLLGVGMLLADRGRGDADQSELA